MSTNDHGAGLSDKESGLSRRRFLQGTSLASLTALVGGATSMFGCAPEEKTLASTDSTGSAVANQTQPDGEIKWNVCLGCGPGKCPLQFHVEDGIITYVEGDTTGSDEFGDDELRSCLRGRSIRRLINHPDRLKYPMKRTGKRGSGEFEQISWDEAIDLFYEKLRYTIDTYGNTAVHLNCSEGGMGGLFPRLMNLNGGFLDMYGSMSYGQIEAASLAMWGEGSGTNGPTSEFSTIRDSDLVICFGTSAATSLMNGAQLMYELARARDRGVRVYNIDVRLGDGESAHPEDWIPIRPGTDAALALALSYVIISEDKHDKDFLSRCCVGFDEETMPESAKGQNKSYLDYIMGTGYDHVAKSPEWASPITQIPVDVIYELAHAIEDAEACFITQGWGLQRRANGENSSRTIMALTAISGHIGKPGTNPGGTSKGTGTASTWSFDPGYGGIPEGENPVKALIATGSAMEAYDRGHEMTALADGVQGADALEADVKFAYLRGSNSLVNSNCDLNWAASIAADESKCEFIVGSDFFLTSSMMYCDLILPEIMPQERQNMTAVTTGTMIGLVYGEKVQEPPFDCRHEYDWMTEIADRFGCKEEFTGGLTMEEWQEQGYELMGKAYNDWAPSWEEGFEKGFVGQPVPPAPALIEFREDPEANPLTTPSGKMEIYSEHLQNIADTWKLTDSRDIISPIPFYNSGFNGYEDVTDEYPLLVSSWKSKIRYHSKFDQIDLLRQACRHVIWINPLDAEERGIHSGDMCRVFNEQGEIHIEARVTPRMIPGAMAMEEGRNRSVDENGADIGANINTLATHHWSPLAKHGPSNSILAQIEKL